MFKVGDLVLRTGGSNRGCTQGGIYRVVSLGCDNSLIYVVNNSGFKVGLDSDNFELVTEYPNPPHKHADLIIEWAKGANIQYWSKISNSWKDINYPTPAWTTDAEYRVKPSADDTKKQQALSQIKEAEDKIKEAKKILEEL